MQVSSADDVFVMYVCMYVCMHITSMFTIIHLHLPTKVNWTDPERQTGFMESLDLKILIIFLMKNDPNSYAQGNTVILMNNEPISSYTGDG